MCVLLEREPSMIGMYEHIDSILYFLRHLAYQSTIQQLPKAKRFISSIIIEQSVLREQVKSKMKLHA